MRGLARFVATSTLVIGCLAALVLVLVGFSSFGNYGGGTGFLLFGWAFGVFLTSAASACILSLLASIDERLQSAGYATAADAASNGDARLPTRMDRPGHPVRDGEELDSDLESKLNFQRTHGRS